MQVSYSDLETRWSVTIHNWYWDGRDRNAIERDMVGAMKRQISTVPSEEAARLATIVFNYQKWARDRKKGMIMLGSDSAEATKTQSVVESFFLLVDATAHVERDPAEDNNALHTANNQVCWTFKFRLKEPE